MAPKKRVTPYDIGSETSTRPDMVPAENSFRDDSLGDFELERPGARVLPPYPELMDAPPRWNEPTVPDLPLQISAAQPGSGVRIPSTVPKSGPRHRAPSPSDMPATRATVSPVSEHEMHRAGTVPQRTGDELYGARRNTKLWLRAALLVAVTIAAAAGGAAFGTGTLLHFTESSEAKPAPPRNEPAPAPVSSPHVTSSEPVTSLAAPRSAAAREQPGVPVVRFEDLPRVEAAARTEAARPRPTKSRAPARHPAPRR